MKIVILFPHMIMRGGALNYTLKTAELLANKMDEVVILTLLHDPTEIKVPASIRVVSMDGPLTSAMSYWLRFFRWQRRIEKAIETEAPDLLIAHVFPSNWWGWLYKRKRPEAKLLWICHEPSAFIHSKAWIRALRPVWKSLIARVTAIPFRVIDRSLAQKSDCVVVNSQFTAKACQNVYGLTPSAVAYPAVDTSVFYPRPNKKNNRLLSVGHLSKFKNIDFLLHVFADAVQRRADLEYWIVGAGEEKEVLKALADDLTLSERITWVEDISAERLGEIYSEAAVLLHGAVDEPFGMVPLEALASGTPVLAHASGGPKEVVTEDIFGSLLNSKSPAEWSQAIIAILDHRTAPNEIAARAKQFSWENTTEQLKLSLDPMCPGKK